MTTTGMTVNELIKKLIDLKEQGHGDAVVIVGGTDYPEGARSVRVEKSGNGYRPKGSVGIH